MITEEKIKQVRKQLRRGTPQGEIKTELLAKGFSEMEINELFLKATVRNQDSAKSSGKENNSADIFGIAGMCFLILGVAVLSTQTWLKEYGAWMIIAGITGVGVRFYLANQHRS